MEEWEDKIKERLAELRKKKQELDQHVGQLQLTIGNYQGDLNRAQQMRLSVTGGITELEKLVNGDRVQTRK